MNEYDIYGMFVPALLVFALFGALLTALVRRLLAAVGFYRFVWHPPLFDLALFIVDVGIVFSLFNGLRSGAFSFPGVF